MKKILHYLFIVSITLCLHSTTYAQGSCDDGSYNFSDISVILNSSTCGTCHTGGNSQGGWNYDTYAGLIAAGNCGVANVVPGNTLGSLLYDKIDGDGAVSCGGAMPNGAPPTAAAFSAVDLAAIEAWINAGAFENCRGVPEDDGLCDPLSTIEPLNPPTETTICSDGSNAPTFAAPLVSLPDVEIAVEINGTLVDISTDGTFDSSMLAIGDEVCYTAFSFDLLAINDLLNTANTLCGALDCDAVFGIPGVEMAISDLVNGVNDGTPGLNDLNEALAFAGSFGSPIQSVQSAVSTLNSLNETIGAFNLGPVCFATSNNVCLQVEECIICPTVVDVIPPQNICPNAGAETFCVEFDMPVDANTVLTVEGIFVQDGSAGGTQICVDIIPPPVFDPCIGSAFDFLATAICDGTDLLADFVWLSTQILPITDAACGGIAGCMDDTACNFNPSAVCDDPAAPCIPAPTCNADPCLGDTEIIDPNDACACIVDQLQVLGCTDANACNYNADANCDDSMCDLGNTACADPCDEPDPDDGCALTTDTFDAATCTVTNTPNCAAGETFDAVNCLCTTDPVLGCTNPCADNYNPDATTDDGNCMFPDPDDACALTTDSYDDVNCVVINEAPDVDDGCPLTADSFDAINCLIINEAPDPDDACALTTDAFDAATCMITNTPNCAAGETFDATNCLCTTDPIMGCTNACADNYDPNATVDDGNCMFPSPDDGCDLTTDSYDDVNCVVINEAPDVDDGCDLTTDAFDAATCMIINTPNCPAGETFDAVTCTCVGGTPGCLDPCDPNFDENATVNDPDLCAGYDTTCNSDCLAGDLTVWDAASCSCIIDVVTVLGCTDDTADNYDPAANCDDGTCNTGPCEDMISGAVIADEMGCSAAGIEVTIYDSLGNVVGTATTDATGNYALMGLFECGDYTAELTANIPDCYLDSGGNAGPIGFEVDGDGVADGANFVENPQIPTLSQWGLIILALLLMTFGALSLGFNRSIYLKPS